MSSVIVLVEIEETLCRLSIAMAEETFDIRLYEMSFYAIFTMIMRPEFYEN